MEHTTTPSHDRCRVSASATALRTTGTRGAVATALQQLTGHLALAMMLLVLLLPTRGVAQPKEEPKSFSATAKPLDQVDRRTMKAIDATALLAEDEKQHASAQRPGPLRFAIAEEAAFDPDHAGTWENVPGGRLWRLRLYTPGAVSHNLGITRYALPEGAKLWLYGPDHKLVHGPYTTRDRSRDGSLWTPIIMGDELVVELFVPNGATEVVLLIGKVNKGYRGLKKDGGDKQGSCNNDVICPEGDPWRNEIRSVARYSINGTGLCSGQLVNNTAQDFKPYFLSANHCGVNSGNAATLVFFWNFESPTCGDLAGGNLTQTQTGATFRASNAASDFVLVELDAGEIQPAFNVYFAGWDATGTAPASTVCIHHPRGDEKAISFNTNAVTSTAYLNSAVSAAGNHWRVDDWEDGTTEPGSSGSGIWDATSHRLVGQLHGGNASCSSLTDDWFGKFSTSWTGGSTNDTRLSNWLDPGNTGVLSLDGDPHLTSLDGTHFDFQGAGEYVALRDPAAGEVQVRMTPIATTFDPGPSAHHGLSTCVSLNTAVAVRMGEHRITYEPNLSGVPDPTGLQLRVDGTLTPLGPNGLYVGGGRVAKTSAPGGITITFPSKYVLTVTPGWWASQSKWYLNVEVVRTRADRFGGASFNAEQGIGGLCADIPAGSWLPRLPDGTSMGPLPTSLHQRYVDLYQRFGAAWRVTAATSLFDYAPGTSTADFTRADWPAEHPPCVLPNMVQVMPLDLATAQAASARITDPIRRANCIFDIQVTGDVGFAETYLQAERIADGATITTVNADRAQSQLHERVGFTATVVRTAQRDGATPAGTVQFMVDGNSVGAPVTLDANGSAVWTTADLALGTHTVSAHYAPASGSTLLASGSLQAGHTVVAATGGDAEHGDGGSSHWLLWLLLALLLLVVIIWWLRRS